MLGEQRSVVGWREARLNLADAARLSHLFYFARAAEGAVLVIAVPSVHCGLVSKPKCKALPDLPILLPGPSLKKTISSGLNGSNYRALLSCVPFDE